MKKRKIMTRTWRGATLISLALVSVLALSACGVKAENSQGLTTEAPGLVEPAETEQPEQTPADEPKQEAGIHKSVEDAATLPTANGKNALSTTDIYTKCSPSVVSISSVTTTTNFFGQLAEYPSAGSGVVISQDGYILTCNHVIADMSDLKVMTSDGNKYEATVVGGDSRTDLAVLKIEADNLVPIALGDSDELQIGELAVAIGNPLGEFANSLSVGVISGADREINIDGERMNLLQTDASISPGNSGGALINSYGELIGITSAKSSGSGVEGIGFAIPVNDAKKVVNELVNNGYVSRPQLGIIGMTITEELKEAVKEAGGDSLGNKELPDGVLITEVSEGGAAEQAGLTIGDVITKVNGDDCDGIESLKKLIDASTIGDKLTLTVMHNNQSRTVTVTLAEQPRPSATPQPGSDSQLPDYLEEYFRSR